jgi:hypothetical protein
MNFSGQCKYGIHFCPLRLCNPYRYVLYGIGARAYTFFRYLIDGAGYADKFFLIDRLRSFASTPGRVRDMQEILSNLHCKE